jgi:hypothetical protein
LAKTAHFLQKIPHFLLNRARVGERKASEKRLFPRKKEATKTGKILFSSILFAVKRMLTDASLLICYSFFCKSLALFKKTFYFCIRNFKNGKRIVAIMGDKILLVVLIDRIFSTNISGENRE